MAEQKWVAEDGTVFDTQTEALKHDEEVRVEASLRRCIVKSFDETVKNLLSAPDLIIGSCDTGQEEGTE
jgi:hypothetical protein